MCIQTKRDAATDITKLLMNAEDLTEVIHNELLPLPSGQQVENDMFDDIPERENISSSDDSLLDEGHQGQLQHHSQLHQPSSSSSSSSTSSSSSLSTSAIHIEHAAKYGKHRQKHSNGIPSNHHLNQAQGSSKLNTIRLQIIAAVLAITLMLLIAVEVQNEKQNIDIVRREAEEFHQSARQAIRQVEYRRDMRRVRWGHIEQIAVSIG